MVTGLDSTYVIPRPIVSIQKHDDTNGGDLTATTRLGYIPWYRWAFISDARFNTIDSVDWMATRVYNNNKNPRVTAKFRSWGKPTLFPLDMISFDIRALTGTAKDKATDTYPKTNNIDLRAPGSLFRILSVSDTFDFEKGSYFTDFETEFFDPEWGWAAWWDPAAPMG